MRYISTGFVTLFGSTVLALVGCAASYVPPTSGPQANLRLKVEHDQYAVTFDLWTKGPCVRPGQTLALVGSPKFVRTEYAREHYVPIGMLDGAKEPSTYVAERVIAAGQPIFLDAHAILATSINLPAISATTCRQIIEFTPTAGSQYEVTHTYGSGSCTVQISELTATGGTVRRMPIRDARQRACSQ